MKRKTAVGLCGILLILSLIALFFFAALAEFSSNRTLACIGLACSMATGIFALAFCYVCDKRGLLSKPQPALIMEAHCGSQNEFVNRVRRQACNAGYVETDKQDGYSVFIRKTGIAEVDVIVLVDGSAVTPHEARQLAKRVMSPGVKTYSTVYISYAGADDEWRNIVQSTGSQFLTLKRMEEVFSFYDSLHEKLYMQYSKSNGRLIYAKAKQKLMELIC